MPLLGSRGAASARGFGLFGGIPEAAPTVLGQAYGGGYYAGQISVNGDGIATHYLVISPKASGESTSKQWKTTNTSTTGTGSVIAGPTNSANMNNALHPAAQFCESLAIGGYGDWYLPALYELELIYYNLKPGTQLNDINWGLNTYAIPSRVANYTTTDPAQTSVSAFQTGGSEAFELLDYWTSTQSSTTNAYCINFDTGTQNNYPKIISLCARAVRRVAI